MVIKSSCLIKCFRKAITQYKNNERLNCFTLNLISDAKEKFQKYSEEQLKGRLFGKLISVKDNINIKGFPTTCSSAILDGYISFLFY